MPVHDNLFVWHGNVQMADELFHFEVTFSDSYPVAAPRVMFLTAVPHVNVQHSGALCCPLLGNSNTGDSWTPSSSLH